MLVSFIKLVTPIALGSVNLATDTVDLDNHVWKANVLSAEYDEVRGVKLNLAPNVKICGKVRSHVLIPAAGVAMVAPVETPVELVEPASGKKKSA